MADSSNRPTAPGGVRTVLQAPVSGWAWRATIHPVVGFPLAVAGFVVTLTLLAMTLGLAVTAVLALVTLVMLLWALRALTAAQRSRFRSVLGVEIPPLARPSGSGIRGVLAWARSAATWRQVTYHLLAFPINTFSFVAVTAAWSTGFATAGVFAYSRLLPDKGVFGWQMRDPGTLAALTAGGLLLLLVTPWVAQGLADVDAAMARALLGPSRVEELARRVDTLTVSREGVVDAADAERRRIERDLHDGTQQRLVSLAMNLGMARSALADAPEDVRVAVEEAHEEAKRTLTELRGFIRGLHPAVLDDRGLDAALSGIAARAPLPVSVRVTTPGRCSPTIEAVAYFVVSEALTNVARHSGATQAQVLVEPAGAGRIRVVVSDNGHGGAASELGTGLRGLAQRVASVDGTLRVDSPAGGPTAIVAELPCER